MPRCADSGSLSVPMSKPRYTAVESQLMISPSYRSASARASALFPVAVGPRIATTRGVTNESAGKRERRPAAGPGQVAASGSLRFFVVEERHREKGFLGRIFGRQRRG